MTTLVLDVAPPRYSATDFASESQRRAIEAPSGPCLVVAGPGSGKTFCLIERIRFLVDQLGVDPARICAFTFTNKAAGEIRHRLDHSLGGRASHVRAGTIHAFCAELLRHSGSIVGVRAGFGIVDEAYGEEILHRVAGFRKTHRYALGRFSVSRLRGDALSHRDVPLLAAYERYLAERNLLDFDLLLIKAAELLECTDGAAATVMWDAVLVDEFQDVNQVQYRIIRALSRLHQNVFAVGDYEQSIYSWTGADPRIFACFMTDFGVVAPISLLENRRCPRELFDLARRLVSHNAPIFDGLRAPEAHRSAEFPVEAVIAATDDNEVSWIIEDLVRDRANNRFDYGDAALLYRKHDIGERAEAALLNAGIPCRLARGRAFAEDPVIAYVLAALQVIARPNDRVYRDRFFESVLPGPLCDRMRVLAQSKGHDLARGLRTFAALPKGNHDARIVRRAIALWRNLRAIGMSGSSLDAVVHELLSQRVGVGPSKLEERHDELSDPIDHDEVARAAARLRVAQATGRPALVPATNGIGIPLKAILAAADLEVHLVGGPVALDGEPITAADFPTLGLALGAFKAAQLLASSSFPSGLLDFTAIDIETTGDDPTSAEIVQLGAVRVRDGQLVEEFHRLVRPRVPISSGATQQHRLKDVDVVNAAYFEHVWPEFRRFCGADVIIAHNGYDFDFPILKRMVKALGDRFEFCIYDTLPLARDLCRTGCKLEQLSNLFSIDPGLPHQALDDARTLARVMLKLDERKAMKARKTALGEVLGHLGVALALSDRASLCPEARLMCEITRVFALGRYSGALEHYEREAANDESVPAVDEVIEWLGGAKVMARIRADKSAEDRYPSAIVRLRRLIEQIPPGPLEVQLAVFLQRAVLSKWEGHEPEAGRVSLLTLHSTKGLEFSRVYILGVEDAELPGQTLDREITAEEVAEARRLLYVGMTRAKDRLVMSCATARNGHATGGHKFLTEMGLTPRMIS